MRTRITDLLGIEKPVLQGGMQWLGHAELAAAVSEAGGFGLITALTFPSPEDLHAEVLRCHELTDKPFGINLTRLPTINPPPYDEYREAAVSAGITAVETSGSNPVVETPFYQRSGVAVLHKATSVKHALKAVEAGVDAVIVDGFECAGHPGEDDVPLLVLLPAIADRVAVPILAAGGIADGRGLAAALALGADGIVMGTRLMATREARLHPRVKQRLVENDERETNLIFRELRNTARVARNAVSDKVVEILRAGGQFEDVRELVAGRRGKEVYETGDLDAGIWWAGLAQALVHDVPSCAELLNRIVTEATSLIESRLRLVAAG